MLLFQSTHPHGVRPNRIEVIDCPLQFGFNPRTHTGCDQGFRPTLPARADVSIHAPTRGATGTAATMTVSMRRFNPRTHTGCDGMRKRMDSYPPLFQSTHPHGVRLFRIEIIIIINSFNPRTHTGCDEAREHVRRLHERFNPRTHTGCDSVQSYIL